MTRQRFDENVDHRDALAAPDTSLMCRMPGCRDKWTVDILHGRVCSMHDEALSRAGTKGQGLSKAPAGLKSVAAAISLRAPVRPYSEPVEHDPNEGFEDIERPYVDETVDHG